MAVGKQYISLIAERTIASTDGYTSAKQTSAVHKGVMITIDRESETGAATLDAVVQYQNPMTGAWADIEGANFVQWADSATGERYMVLYPGITGAEADAAIPLDTNKGVLVNAYLPLFWRLSLTTTGTTNVVSAAAVLLP